MSKRKPEYRLLVRHYPEGEFVSVWVQRAIHGKGPYSSLLFGEVPPAAAKELAEATGLPVVEEKDPNQGWNPMSSPECASFLEQKEMFPE